MISFVIAIFEAVATHDNMFYLTQLSIFYELPMAQYILTCHLKGFGSSYHII